MKEVLGGLLRSSLIKSLSMEIIFSVNKRIKSENLKKEKHFFFHSSQEISLQNVNFFQINVVVAITGT